MSYLDEELVALVEGLGVHRKLQTSAAVGADDEAGLHVYQKSQDAFDCIKDLQRLLRRERNSETKDVFTMLGSWNVVRHHLLPMLHSYRDNPHLAFEVCKLLVMLTLPPDPTSHDVPRQLTLLQDFKESFLHENAITVLVWLLRGPLERKASDRTEDDNAFVELLLTLLKNLLQISDSPRRPGYESNPRAMLHERFLEVLEREHMLDCLLALCETVPTIARDETPTTSATYQWVFLLLHVLRLVLYRVDARQLAELERDQTANGAKLGSNGDRRLSTAADAARRSAQQRFPGSTLRHQLRATVRIEGSENSDESTVPVSPVVVVATAKDMTSDSPSSLQERVELGHRRLNGAHLGTFRPGRSRALAAALSAPRTTPWSTRTQKVILQFVKGLLLPPSHAFTNLMVHVKGHMARDNPYLQADETNFMWLIGFSCGFVLAQYDFHVAESRERHEVESFNLRIDRILTEQYGHAPGFDPPPEEDPPFIPAPFPVAILRAVFNESEFRYLAEFVEQFDAERNYTGLEIAAGALRELVGCLRALAWCGNQGADDRCAQLATFITSRLFYERSFEEKLPTLLRKFRPTVHSRRYLVDLFVTTHYTMQLLRECSEAAPLIVKSRMRAVSVRKKKNKTSGPAEAETKEEAVSAETEETGTALNNGNGEEVMLPPAAAELDLRNGPSEAAGTDNNIAETAAAVDEVEEQEREKDRDEPDEPQWTERVLDLRSYAPHFAFSSAVELWISLFSSSVPQDASDSEFSARFPNDAQLNEALVTFARVLRDETEYAPLFDHALAILACRRVIWASTDMLASQQTEIAQSELDDFRRLRLRRERQTPGARIDAETIAFLEEKFNEVPTRPVLREDLLEAVRLAAEITAHFVKQCAICPEFAVRALVWKPRHDIDVELRQRETMEFENDLEQVIINDAKSTADIFGDGGPDSPSSDREFTTAAKIHSNSSSELDTDEDVMDEIAESAARLLSSATEWAPEEDLSLKASWKRHKMSSAAFDLVAGELADDSKRDAAIVAERLVQLEVIQPGDAQYPDELMRAINRIRHGGKSRSNADDRTMPLLTDLQRMAARATESARQFLVENLRTALEHIVGDGTGKGYTIVGVTATEQKHLSNSDVRLCLQNLGCIVSAGAPGKLENWVLPATVSRSIVARRIDEISRVTAILARQKELRKIQFAESRARRAALKELESRTKTRPPSKRAAKRKAVHAELDELAETLRGGQNDLADLVSPSYSKSDDVTAIPRNSELVPGDAESTRTQKDIEAEEASAADRRRADAISQLRRARDEKGLAVPVASFRRRKLLRPARNIHSSDDSGDDSDRAADAEKDEDLLDDLLESDVEDAELPDEEDVAVRSDHDGDAFGVSSGVPPTYATNPSPDAAGAFEEDLSDEEISDDKTTKDDVAMAGGALFTPSLSDGPSLPVPSTPMPAVASEEALLRPRKRRRRKASS